MAKISTDNELVRSAQTGDLFAFEELVRRYQTRLQHYVRHIIGSQPSAEEVVQDVFLALYETIERIDTSRKVSSYLYAIAKNQAVSFLRRQRPTVSLDDVELVDEDDGLFDALWSKEQGRAVRTALTTLPTRYRRAIELYYFDDLAYKEMSRTLHLPVNTVRTHLLRAKQLLKKKLITL